MYDSAKAGGKAGTGDRARRSGYQLLAENRLLRGAAEYTKQQLIVLRSEVRKERDKLQLLCHANEQLVLATFSAEDQKIAAETTSVHQTAFLSMLAHELRNPIAAIAGANALMIRTQMAQPLAHKMGAIVARQSNHLQHLVDDLLDVARINTGKITLRTELVQLHELIDVAVELSGPALTQRDQRIELDLPAQPLQLIGDSVRLPQVFSNLLINASKFSPPASTIFISAIENDGTVAVSIKDQGIGVAAEDQLRIFDIFAQVPDPSGNLSGGGLGIGLALVKSIVQMHGGSVQVTSDGLNCGSIFTVVLPLPCA